MSTPDENGNYPAKPFPKELPPTAAEGLPKDVAGVPQIAPCDACGYYHLTRLFGRTDRWVEACHGHKVRYRDGDPYNQSEENRVKLPCGKTPLQGMLVCRTHGGARGGTQSKAKERLRYAEMAERLRLELQEVDPQFLEQHPIQGLLEEVARSAQAVVWLASRVSELYVADPDGPPEMRYLTGFDDHGQPTTVIPERRLLGPDHQGNLKPHPYLQLLNDERLRHAKLCKLALDAGVNERMVNIAQAQAMQVVAMMGRALENIGLPPSQIKAAKEALAAEMRALRTPVAAKPIER